MTTQNEEFRPEVEIVESADAAVWAEEFAKRFWGFWKQNSGLTVEGRVEDLNGLMQGWFANAIETGKRSVQSPSTLKSFLARLDNEGTYKPFELVVSPEATSGKDRIDQAIFFALGAASSCWDNLEGAGVFESTRAKEIGEKLSEFIENEFWNFKTTDRPFSTVSDGITALVEQSGTNSRDHGFHDDLPVRGDFVDGERGDKAYANGLRNFWIAKLDLMHEELSEMLGELRSGRAVDEVYYLDKDGVVGPKGRTYPGQVYLEGKPLLKPEGFGIELADLVIRGADLAFLTDLPLAELIAVKHEYNKTRPYKHGRTL